MTSEAETGSKVLVNIQELHSPQQVQVRANIYIDTKTLAVAYLHLHAVYVVCIFVHTFLSKVDIQFFLHIIYLHHLNFLKQKFSHKKQTSHLFPCFRNSHTTKMVTMETTLVSYGISQDKFVTTISHNKIRRFHVNSRHRSRLGTVQEVLKARRLDDSLPRCRAQHQAVTPASGG